MAKITMRQELEILRKEVEDLRKQKAEAEENQQLLIQEAKGEKKAMKQEAETFETEFKTQVNDLVEKIKTDYDNLSPLAAVLIFAMGAILGSSLTAGGKD